MFYTFTQNNSGGSFVINHLLTIHVIVEADSAQEACDRAEDLGIYFDGVDAGVDCDCCGDRWYKSGAEEATEEPLIYGKAPEEQAKNERGWVKDGQPFCRVFYANGEIKEYRVEPTNE